MQEITKTNIEKIDFAKMDGLVPAIVQHAETKDVLMLGYMNRSSVDKTLEGNLVTFFSRSRNELWTKGETSGNYLKFQSMYLDCDHDSLLIKVRPTGPVCHTGTANCFDLPEGGSFNLGKLEAIVVDRKNNPKEGSYTNKLLDRGINKIAQKVGEEAVELVIEAKDDNRELFKGEAADLLYHFSVLLAKKGIPLSEIYQVLEERHKK
ncbi:bifunctional phosphoribosyl-AMP cyclohydrolase/phosphoribosyl-ATP diphosphatase HisIE [Membranihabitans maritimus]|uniref:bifunctional phosphoribosyl-AMP cyclohydrolase/phosphoribosyl-ATP diphosphatase HisIE n=1 Tax=Membranihabitans maritimus TaxID=2904244 RepID=UPI001F01140F|nr:bifunctional phosphoribosyl-AMP cyclohydrolase/phosphoribosyl-ATP diphosphatase HisIE [Membranihabitans maritimus]